MSNKQRRILQVFIIIVLILLLFIIIKYFGRIDTMGEGGDTSKIDVFDIVVLGEEAENDEEVVNIIRNRSDRINEKPIRNSLENMIDNSKGNEVVIANEISNVVENESSNDISNEITNTNEVEASLVIHDDEVEYGNSTRINIFNREKKNTLKNRIAPGDTDTYFFYVRNNNDFGITYRFSFGEVNNDNVNMKYKLKRNGEYILSDWSSIEELEAQDLVLESKTFDFYELEWKWIEADNDTEIGKKEMAEYELDLFFYATEND